MKIVNKILYKLHIKKPPRPNFLPTGILPDSVKEILQEAELNTDSIIYSFKTDMLEAELFGDCYIMFDDKGIYVAEIEESPVQKNKKKKNTPPPKPVLRKLTALPIDEIDEIFAEQYLATGQLTYKFKNEYYSLGYFSIGLLSKADTFRKIFNTFKEKKDYKQYIVGDKDSTCQKCGAPVPSGTHFCKDCVSKNSTIKRLFSFFGDVKWKMVFILLFILLSNGLNLL
ncbi:MAG: hypothetical protein UGF89_01100, partial [Acutalibacteraceae bacterium]|nr:hypothetical protein [Acutalibacteraceae bacterium]